MIIICIILQDKALAGSMGTAWAIRSDGYFITASHVIDGYKKVYIYANKRLLPVTVLAVNKQKDLALLYSKHFKAPRIALDSSYRYKESSAALGFPVPDVKGFNLKMTTGTSIYTLAGSTLEFRITICPGNSGGPVINDKGQARGLVTNGWSLYVFDHKNQCTTEGFGTSTKEIRKFLHVNRILIEEDLYNVSRPFTQLKKDLNTSVVLVYSE